MNSIGPSIRCTRLLLAAALGGAILVSLLVPSAQGRGQSSSHLPTTQQPETPDRPLPDYITGDECLFCHRLETGKSWSANRHSRTIRLAALESNAIRRLRESPALEGVADQVEFVMGGKERLRFLKRGNSYGRLDIHSVQGVPSKSVEPETPLQLKPLDNVRWNADQFGTQCAGCHTTQHDSRSKRFASSSLDCYVCHGAATLDHAADPKKMLLARERRDPPQVTIAICAQCHLRGAHAKSSRLPFPNNFVPGRELFDDFSVDWSLADDERLNPGDRHIYENVRDVIQRQQTNLTCQSCHSVHGQSTAAHRRVPTSHICLNCHNESGPKSARKSYSVHSQVCGY